MAVYAIGATSLIGGAAGALDAEYVNAFGAQPGIGNGDIAFTFYDNKVYHHVANATSGASESSPDVIAPDEESPGVAYTGNLRWILCGIYNAVKISGTPVDNDFAKFTDALTIEGRSKSEAQADLGFYSGAGTFNGTTGDEISIGATLGGTSYQVSILPTGDSLNVGAIYIDTKTTTTFLVKCTGSGTPTFDWKLIDKN